MKLQQQVNGNFLQGIHFNFYCNLSTNSDLEDTDNLVINRFGFLLSRTKTRKNKTRNYI